MAFLTLEIWETYSHLFSEVDLEVELKRILMVHDKEQI